MNITVYLGASYGNKPALKTAAAELGRWIGESGNTLIYGGSKTGLMGVLAEGTLKAGGKVIGVEPQMFVDSQFQYDEITELIVTPDMSQRKKKMIELGDVFIAFPGGTGTLEEISEIMSLVALEQINAPCIFYNLDAYYNDIRNFLNKMIENGLSTREKQKGIYFADDLDQIKEMVRVCECIKNILND